MRDAPTLTLRRTWSDKPEEDDWVVVGNGRRVARIYRDTSSYTERWIWSVCGFNIPQTADMRGDAHSFEQAKTLTKPIVERLIAEELPLL